MDYDCSPTAIQGEQQHRIGLRSHRFVPFKPSIVYRINRDVSRRVLDSYRREAKRIALFVMYLSRTGVDPSESMEEIAIELSDPLASITTVLLFETSALPSKGQPKFLPIKRLLRTIFHPSKRIVTWNDGYADLYPLFNLRYLRRRQQPPIAKCIPLHDRFKTWFHQLYPHERPCNNASAGRQSDHRCARRFRRFSSLDSQWDLSQAHERTFLESPDVSEHLASEIYPVQTIITGHHAMIASIFGCLALSKLRRAIASHWSRPELHFYIMNRRPRPPRSMETCFD